MVPNLKVFLLVKLIQFRRNFFAQTQFSFLFYCSAEQHRLTFIRCLPNIIREVKQTLLGDARRCTASQEQISPIRRRYAEIVRVRIGCRYVAQKVLLNLSIKVVQTLKQRFVCVKCNTISIINVVNTSEQRCVRTV